MTWQDLVSLNYVETEGLPIFEDLIKKIVLENLDNLEKKQQLYCALCNIVWYRTDEKVMYSTDWKSAGVMIADFEGNVRIENHLILGERNVAYADYYWLGNQGHIEEWVEKKLASEGWYPAQYLFEKGKLIVPDK